MEIKKRTRDILFCCALFLVYLIPRTNLNLPLTANEAKEFYTAYSIAKTGKDTNGNPPSVFFPTDNNYISPVGVYTRLPFVSNGINISALRTSTLIFGFLAVILFYCFSYILLKSRTYAFVASLLFSFSPQFITTTIFNIGSVAFLLCVLVVAILLVKKRESAKKILISSAVLAALMFLLSTASFRDFILRSSIFYNSLPSQTTYIIDHKLSTGMLLDSPLVTDKVNLTRIAYNKAFFAIQEFVSHSVSIFDFERLFSPQQAATILQKGATNTERLPIFHLWELPLIMIGLFLCFSSLPRSIKLLSVGLLFGVLIFKTSWFVFLLPIIITIETKAFKLLIENQKMFALLIGIFYLGGLIIFLQDLANYKAWMKPTEIAQKEIWSNVTSNMIGKNKVTVTDRIGESAFFYLAYHQVNPQTFQNDKVLRPRQEAGLVRIEKIGNVLFSSFEYSPATVAEKSIWIGKEREFKDNVQHQIISDGLWIVCNKCQ